jgi:polyisoprenoid-binding protein YceI
MAMQSKLGGLILAASLLPAIAVGQTVPRKAPVIRPPVKAAVRTAVAPPTRYILAPSGNEARYLVREELAGIDFPYDAIGRTTAITGAIVLDGKGALVPAQSHFSVDVTTLKSDRANRDRYLRTDALETNKYPRVELAITALRGFPATLPASGQFAFELVGNMTVRTVTRPVTWQVTATASNGEFTGTAKTAFKFGDFGMPVPSAFMVMKLEDNLRLEYDFHFVRDTTAKQP